MTALVSIVITSYNYGSYIGEAIESALCQTHRNLEVIVLDNASDDNSVDVISAFDDQRIRFIRNPSNIGLWPNQNKGISLATGDYVLFLSADDRLLPRHVEETLKLTLERPDVDIVYSPYIMIDEAGKVIDRFDHPAFKGLEQYAGRNELASLLTEDSYMCFPTALFPRRLFGMYGMLDESFEVGADYEFFIRMAFHKIRFAFRATPTVCVRVHANNMSGPARYVRSGRQVREYAAILAKYVVSSAFGSLSGYRNALGRMIQNKLLDLERSFPGEYAELRAELEPRAAAVLQQIAKVPDSSPTSEPLISVIVPSSGNLRLLTEALDSLAMQDYPNWEAVVVIDGSFDPSGFLESLPYGSQVRTVRTLSRRGAAFSRNAALRLSHGKVIAYLDDDNRFLPGYLAAVARAFSDPGVNVTVARASVVIGDVPRGTYRAGMPSVVAPDIALNAVAHRRCCVDVMQYFNEALVVLEDWELLLRYGTRYAFTPLDVVAAEVRVRQDLDGHELFGRRQPLQWNSFSQVLNSIYQAYPASGPDVTSARERYAQELTPAINAVLGSRDDSSVLRFITALTGALPEPVRP